MGEIYRSAAVTGLRRLDSNREQQAERRKQKKQNKTGASAKAIDSEQARARSAVSEEKPEVAVAPDQEGQVSLESELDRLGDLCDVQQKRIEQLEAEKEELLSDLKELVAELQAAKEQTDQQHELETSAGYEAGMAQAQDEIDKERKKLISDTGQLRELFSSNLEEQMQKVDEFAVEIAFAALTRVVGERFGDEAFTRSVVSQAVDSVRGARKVAVHVAQQDYELMSQFADEITASGQISEIEFVADPRVTVGGCMIETETGVWDARLETQLQRLRDAIDSRND